MWALVAFSNSGNYSGFTDGRVPPKGQIWWRQTPTAVQFHGDVNTMVLVSTVALTPEPCGICAYEICKNTEWAHLLCVEIPSSDFVHTAVFELTFQRSSPSISFSLIDLVHTRSMSCVARRRQFGLKRWSFRVKLDCFIFRILGLHHTSSMQTYFSFLHCSLWLP